MTEAPTEPPVSANRVDRRSTARKRRAPLAVVLIPIVLIGVVVLILVLRDGNGGGIIPFVGEEEDLTVPEFDFRVSSKVQVVATNIEADLDALELAAEDAGAEVTPVLDALYTGAFLDPGNWRDGDYEEVFGLFADGALGAAQGSVETLTLGAGAGDLYEAVTPNTGALQLRVLFDPEGNPATVVARVRFRALAELKDGTFRAIVSKGSFFLQDVDGWKITAFDVTRNDKRAQPPGPTVSPTSSPTP